MLLLRFFACCAAASVVALAGGCSSGGSTGPDGDDDTPGDRVYVDASYSGVEEGTQERPFDTIEEGIAAAERGDIVVLAAGAYTPSGDVYVPRPMTIAGAGAALTIVNADFLVTAGPDSTPVTVKRLHCPEVEFGFAATAFAPLVVDSCSIEWVAITYPPNHRYTLRNSAVLEDVRFAHADSDSAWHTVEDCVVGGNVEFAHGGGDVVNTVEHCTIAGGISNRAGNEDPPYPTLRIIGNTLHGISDTGYGAFTTIAWNTLPTGDIDDRSEGTGTPDDQVIEYNVLLDGHIELRCASATVRYNTITDSRDTVGIWAASGTPTNIIGNTINLPYCEPRGEPRDWNDCGIRLYSGEGVATGNTINGSAIGIKNRSLAGEISGNTVNGAHTGLYANTLHGTDSYSGNTFSDCAGDGILVEAAAGGFSDNVITGSGGAGVRLRAPADFGGGSSGSAGGNTITGNAGYDLFVEVPADSAAVIFAEANVWDHSTEGEVEAEDLWDASDDPTLADVDVAPLGGGR